MPGWHLTFKFREGGNDIDIELRGSEQAIRVGLNLAAPVAWPRLNQRLARRPLPKELAVDAGLLGGIDRGEVAIRAHEGKFLRIRPDDNASGLSTSVSVTWDD